MIDLTGIVVLLAFWWYLHEAFKVTTKYDEPHPLEDQLKADRRRGNPWFEA